ncbi:sugar ABC transporter substrate-binding protein [Nakamurella flava]|nr:sugar ABC transporter substrate-binding protein [Nakamurella flava]
MSIRDHDLRISPTLSVNPPRRARRAATALIAATGLVLAGCTSTGEAGTGSSAAGQGVDVSAAVAAVKEASAVPAFQLQAPPVDMTKIAGKKVYVIPLSSQIPYVTAVDAEIKSVVEQHGATYLEFPNSGQPTEWAAGITQAIAQQADVIILSQGPDPKLLVPQLQQAKEAGIPVVLSHLYQVGEELPSEVDGLIAATTNVDFAEAGRLMADAAIARSGGAVNALIITSTEVAPSQSISDAVQATLKERCPDTCKATVENVPVADWATRLSSTTQTALQRDPDINWVIPLYDSMSLGVISGITSAGKTTGVDVASYNGTPDILKLIQDGGPMKVDVGESTAWLGRAAADQAFRLLAGQEPIAGGDVKTPLRIFTPDNVGEAGTPPQATLGYGDAYSSGYDALWTSGQ